MRERVDTEPCVGAGDVLWSAVLLAFCSFPPRHLTVVRKRNESVLLTPPRLQRLSASVRRLSRRFVRVRDGCLWGSCHVMSTDKTVEAAPSGLLSVVDCLLSVVCCRLSVVDCLLSVVDSLLSILCCRFSVDDSLSTILCCLLSIVCRRLSVACCLLSIVCCRLSVCFCLSVFVCLLSVVCNVSVVVCGCVSQAERQRAAEAIAQAVRVFVLTVWLSMVQSCLFRSRVFV